MYIAYARVSTLLQNEARQIEAIKEYAAKEKFKIDKWFVDKCSGKNTNRPQYQAMMEFAREGDTIIAQSLDRFSRSLKDLENATADLQKRGIVFRTVKEASLFSGNPAVRDLIIAVLGAISQFERAIILERQREGIKIAKKMGKYKGRKKIKKPENWEEIFNLYAHKQITGTDAMKKLGLARTTFYRMAKEEFDKICKNSCS